MRLQREREEGVALPAREPRRQKGGGGLMLVLAEEVEAEESQVVGDAPARGCWKDRSLVGDCPRGAVLACQDPGGTCAL